MRSRIIIAVLAILALTVTTTALAAPSHPRRTLASPSLAKKYESLYRQVQKEHGKRAPGRDIVRYGLSNGKPAKSHHVAQSIRTLRNILHPPPAPAPVVAASAAPTSATTTSYSGGGAGGIAACIRQHESGGNYHTDTGNGYGGAYQFDQQTWTAATGSTGSPAQASPAEQDAAFAHWYPSHHSAWPVTGPACGG